MSKGFALITGASAGIGEATAWELARAGFDLLLVARRKERLLKLQSELIEKTRAQVQVATVDVSSRSSLEKFIKENDKILGEISVLVNNAGLARGADKVQEARLEDWEEMIQTNVMGLLNLTRLVLPYFLNKKRGHIVNMGSVAGRWVYPGGAVYCASKYAVRAFTDGLRMDLMGSNIRVTNIEPGMVNTEFSTVRFRDEKKAQSVYLGMTPLTAQDIAETITWVVSRPLHVNVQELVIYPTDQAAIGMVHRQS